ncbi:MAG: Gfo/Idh/MocA family oxidoreductase [Candidatus Poribacteria bacterium]|nr:Gfo/Idh/MocA family oxidoreductase [Candidatus Poribacteria bacterium]
MKTAKPLRLAVVGLGQRGLQHLKTLWQLQAENLVRIVALVDAYPDNLTADKIGRYIEGFSLDGIQATTDFTLILETTALDAVYFAIPPGVHNGELIAATRAGLHVFAEKPMSLSLKEAIEMQQAIEASGVISTVGFQQRYDPRYETAHRFLQDKRLVMMSMIYNSTLEGHSVKHTHTEKQGGPGNRVWAANFEWSGSTVVEAGIHQTDLMRYWAGDISWVEANYIERDASDIVDGGDNPYAYQVTFGFETGTVGNLILSRLRQVFYTDSYNSILWTNGHLKFEGDEVVAYYAEGVMDQPLTQTDVRHALPVDSQQNATERISRAFVEAINRNDQTILKSSFSSGMNSLAAVLGANASHRLGGKRIYLKPLLTGLADA